MTIHHFASNQNLVFVPALLALLVAVVLICLPVVFVQMLRRTRRLVPVAITAGVLAAAVLVLAAWQAGVGFRTLGDERARVQAEIAQRYDLRLSGGQVGELVDGGKPERTLPAVAAAAGLRNPDKAHTLHLVAQPKGSDVYALEIGNRPWPR